MISAMTPADLRQAHPLRLAMLAADEVRQHLREYANATDRPTWEAVQAADLLDTVAELLAKAVAR
jgi:hypothetical protein